MNAPRTLATAIALALALPAAANTPSKPDPRMEKLGACMKLAAASPDQKKCLDELKAMPQPAATASAASTKKTTAAAPAPAIKSATAQPTVAAAKAAVAPPVPQDVKLAAAQLGVNGSPAPTSPPSVAPPGSIGQVVRPQDISGMDLETAMMAIQQQRANLLESQLKDQIGGIQARNDEIAKLNTMISELKAQRPAGGDAAAWANLAPTQAAARDLYQRLKVAGVSFPTGNDEVNEPGTGIFDARQRTFDVWIEQLKMKIDSLNSSQQMDMLRMQSLSNKRNEAFELMTNFIKKMQDSRSSILGNMR